jgi:hypothetical protein
LPITATKVLIAIVEDHVPSATNERAFEGAS